MTDEQRLEKNKRIKEAGQATREKRKHQVCKVFVVKIDESRLTNKQSEQLKMLFVEAKWMYNDALTFSKDNDIKDYDTKTKTVTVFNKDKEPEMRELKYISAQMKQSVLSGIQSSIKSLSARKKNSGKVGALKYISEYKSIELRQYNMTFKIYSHNRIKIQNISDKIVVNGLNQFINIPGIEIANAHILNKPDGYYIAITTYQNISDLPEKEYINEEIGIDFGIKNNITLSNGETFNCSIGETKRLKRLQRKMSRQQKGSNNRYKTKRLIRKEYQKIDNKKNDSANKLIHYLLSYKDVYMQDENLSGWHSGWFGKQVQYSIMGTIKHKLLMSSQVHVLDRYAPTTKYCPICGNIKSDISLSDRAYHCDNCGYTNDRDIHSANNMIIMFKKLDKFYLPEHDTLVSCNGEKLPTEHREFKPVENTIVSNEAGRLHPLGCN